MRVSVEGGELYQCAGWHGISVLRVAPANVGRMAVVRLFLLFVLSAVLLLADPFKLYLKDGNYHLVREYVVQGDRIRFYSTERSEWEEIPSSLVDLNRTESERKARADEIKRETQEEDEEDQAERAYKREIASIPVDTGAYYKQGDAIKALPAAEYRTVTDKKRQVLMTASPIPIIPGKASVIIQGSHSNFVIHENRPAFYLRLSKEERFGIIKLTPKKNTRVVENVAIVPVSKENIEERKQMETFDQQLAENLYKVWPEKTLTPGEYALVEYSEGDIDMIIWDFAYQEAQGSTSQKH